MVLAALAALAPAQGAPVPAFRVDPAWPRPLPNNWIVGAVVGVAVDGRDHIWIAHRPSTLQPNETRSIWRAAPPILEFEQDGALVSSWGGPGEGYEWPQLEHGVYVDRDDNVWIGAGGKRRAYPEVHARRQVPDANRPSGAGARQQRYGEPRRRGADGGRRGRA
jgi:hypothetical protein